MATAILNTSIPNIFSQTNSSQRNLKRKAAGKLIARQLHEVLYGTRPYIEVYSNTLQHPICFVNEGLINPKDLDFDGKIITMKMLANIITDDSDILHNVETMLFC